MFTRAFIENMCEDPDDLDKDDDGFVTWTEFASRVSVDANKIFREAYERIPADSSLGMLTLRRVGTRHYVHAPPIPERYRPEGVLSSQTEVCQQIRCSN